MAQRFLLVMTLVICGSFIFTTDAIASCEDCYECSAGLFNPITANCCAGDACNPWKNNEEDCRAKLFNMDDCMVVKKDGTNESCSGTKKCSWMGGGDWGNCEYVNGYCPPECMSCGWPPDY